MAVEVVSGAIEVVLLLALLLAAGGTLLDTLVLALPDAPPGLPDGSRQRA